MKKILIFTSVIILLLVGIRFSITKIGEFSRQKAIAKKAVIDVELSCVKEVEVNKSVEIPGRIESPDKVDIIARVDGYLQKKFFSEGDFVRKGQTLLVIEPTQYLNILNKAKADVENAKAKLYKATKDYGRGLELVKKDYISKSTYDGLYAEKLSANAELKAAVAALAEAKRNYGYTHIQSPVDGKIGSLKIHEGNFVTVQSGTIATVIKTNPIYVKYSIDSKQFDELRSQNFIPNKNKAPVMADIILPSGKIYPMKGVQDFWDNEISQTTGTIDFRATFKNDNNVLIPGDFVKVKVYSNEKSKEIAVPQDVVLQDAKGRYVFIADENNLVQVQYIKDKGQSGNYWIISEGLKKGDKYISTNITKLMPKMKINIIEKENN